MKEEPTGDSKRLLELPFIRVISLSVLGLFAMWWWLFRPFPYVGEGEFSEYGWGRVPFRNYQIKFGEVPLNSAFQKEYEIRNLPPTRFAFGFKMDKDVAASCSAEMKLLLMSLDRERVYLEYEAPLSDWNRSVAGNSTEAFLTGDTIFFKESPSSMTLAVAIISPDTKTNTLATLTARGGGWK